MESILETKAITLVQFLQGLRGELHVTLEEGAWATWLYDVLKPRVQEVVVCNRRRNALLKEGSKSDKVDARKLAELLRAAMLRPVYHGEHGLRTPAGSRQPRQKLLQGRDGAGCKGQHLCPLGGNGEYKADFTTGTAIVEYPIQIR